MVFLFQTEDGPMKRIPAKPSQIDSPQIKLSNTEAIGKANDLLIRNPTNVNSSTIERIGVIKPVGGNEMYVNYYNKGEKEPAATVKLTPNGNKTKAEYVRPPLKMEVGEQMYAVNTTINAPKVAGQSTMTVPTGAGIASFNGFPGVQNMNTNNEGNTANVTHFNINGFVNTATDKLDKPSDVLYTKDFISTLSAINQSMARAVETNTPMATSRVVVPLQLNDQNGFVAALTVPLFSTRGNGTANPVTIGSGGQFYAKFFDEKGDELIPRMASDGKSIGLFKADVPGNDYAKADYLIKPGEGLPEGVTARAETNVYTDKSGAPMFISPVADENTHTLKKRLFSPSEAKIVRVNGDRRVKIGEKVLGAVQVQDIDGNRVIPEKSIAEYNIDINTGKREVEGNYNQKGEVDYGLYRVLDKSVEGGPKGATLETDGNLKQKTVEFSFENLKKNVEQYNKMFPDNPIQLEIIGFVAPLPGGKKTTEKPPLDRDKVASPGTVNAVLENTFKGSDIKYTYAATPENADRICGNTVEKLKTDEVVLVPMKSNLFN